jgi:hypothetical protein
MLFLEEKREKLFSYPLNTHPFQKDKGWYIHCNVDKSHQDELTLEAIPD